MRYESQGPTELGVLPQGIESIVVDDLCFPSEFAFIRENPVPAELVQAGAAVTVELMDYAGADEESLLKSYVTVVQNLLPSMGSPL
jgi:hypothetical protein